MHKSEMGKQKGTKTNNNSSENFPCGSCKLNCKNYCINCFKCNSWFHVACTDLSHENFVALDKINGAFWACIACRANVIGNQNHEIENLQNNFQQSVAGIRDDLQKEITEFKSEMLNNIEEIKLTLKNSRYENEPQKLTENLRAKADLTSQSERENKIIVFGVSEKTSDTMITVLDRISHDKKSVKELSRKTGIQTLNIEDIFRLGNFDSTQTRPRPLVVKLSNTWNCRIMMMSNAKLKADDIFIKQFLSKKEWEKEKQALEYRFKLAQTLNINRSDIKIRSARLFFRKKMIDTNLSIEENSCLLTNSPEFS